MAEDAKKKDETTAELSPPVLPLRDIVVFPHMIVPLFVGREKSVRALEEVMNDEKQILLLTQKNAAEDDPTAEGLHTIGTLATVLQLLKLPDQTVRVLVEGKSRARVTGFNSRSDFFQATVEKIPEGTAAVPESEALMRTVKANFEQYIKLNKKIPSETLAAVAQIDDPAKLADTVASHLSVKIGERQALLETFGTTERLEKILSLIEAEIGVLQVARKIRSRVKRQMEKTQREY
ncbi:MAG: LON peptidase substrate-binding domain-containing protein, partial [Alphaproteobacteria bacterium]